MNIKQSLITLLIALVMCGALTAEGQRSHPSEQLHFSAEESGVKKTVPIPEDVAAILRNDNMVRNILEDQNIW
jgi:hypothetical protein